MNNLDHYKSSFNSVGWFIPPYVGLGFLGVLSKSIADAKGSFSQVELEVLLSLIYSPENLSTMVANRYPAVPFIKDYKEIISESVLAHFFGLHHVAVTGLMPVIEGAGTALAKDYSIQSQGLSTRGIFISLADNCKEYVRKKNLGAVGEAISMIDSFKEFADKNLYIESSRYPHSDNTNRHGISHGAYSDDDYGEPINFYKAIAAINFLCFISAFKARFSSFAPEPTEKSNALAKYYLTCRGLSSTNPLKLSSS